MLDKTRTNLEIDNLDIEILSILMNDATTAYTEIAKELIDNSGMPILSAVQFQEAADQVQKALS